MSSVAGVGAESGGKLAARFRQSQCEVRELVRELVSLLLELFTDTSSISIRQMSQL